MPKQKISNFRGYIQCELSEQQSAELKTASFTWEDYDKLSTELLEQGYTLTLAWDSYNNCYRASMGMWVPKHDHLGWQLSGRGSTPLKAFKQLCYKHFQILREIWGAGMGQTKTEIDD